MTFRLIVKFEKLNLDVPKATAAIEKAIEVQMRQAAREMLRAIIVKVPVFTGMARGTMQPLGRFLRVAVPITPKPGAKKYPGKNAAAGALASSFTFANSGGLRPRLRFDPGVAHFQTNDKFDVSERGIKLRNPTPWHALQAGREAFKIYLRQNLKKRVPRISSFVTRTRVINK